MRALVAGAGGFIGGHLTKKILDQGFDVTAVDKKSLSDWYQVFDQANNLSLDLSESKNCHQAVEGSDWVFNLAADMGGMGFIEKNKALCMISVLINTNLLVTAKNAGVKKYFFASSACVYASQFQNINISKSISLKEQNAYPADPEDGYGWEKLFSERMCRHFFEDFNFEVRVARYHNVYGPYGTFYGGREKAPSAAIRKILEFKSKKSDHVEIWGNGKQLRSFTYIDDCVDGTLLLMNSNYTEPINIGSSETISIQELYDYAATSCGVINPPYTYNLTAPVGVLGRSSNNDLCLKILDWEPKIKFKDGIAKTANWITSQTNKN
jgi:nucleoside-diphosphate-sugar epimerase